MISTQMLKLSRHGLHRAQVLSYRICYRRHFSMRPLIEDLRDRGLAAEITRPEILSQKLKESGQGVYAGIDPTGKSLHVGHLLPMLVLVHFQLRGHRVFPLIGGATGLVGDPSGRLIERQAQDRAYLESNALGLKKSIYLFFERALEYSRKNFPESEDMSPKVDILNNLQWLKDLNLLEFIQKVGHSARVNTMLARESVQTRLKSKHGMSFAEFTYQLLQAYDFYSLYREPSKKCIVQVGGSDQWGNILAGLDLINTSDNSGDTSGKSDELKGAFGVLTPLLTTASGEKFGKSAGNAVWLDATMTSIFDFYQFFLKTSDTDVERHLKMFTLMPLRDIQETINRHECEPEKRLAQRLLADEVTELVHTESGVRQARAATQVLFESDYSQIEAKDVVQALSGNPRLVHCDAEELFTTPIPKLIASFGLTSSIGAARQLITSNGLSVNGKRINDVFMKVTENDLIDEQLIIVRAGKDKHLVIARQ